jgi:hypothetical protein
VDSPDVEVELARVVDMLRSMPIPKLGRPMVDEGPTRAQAARDLAQWLADAAAGQAGWSHREVPDVGDPAVGDQIAVTGRDLLDVDPPAPILREANDRLRELRLAL